MGNKRVVYPPPYRRRPDLRVIQEVPSASLGLLLWRALRNIVLWLDTPENQRGELFRSGMSSRPTEGSLYREACGEAPELAQELERLDLFLRAPFGISPARLADACQSVAIWAARERFVETAIHFVEAGALLDQGNPRRANLAGSLTRNLAAYSRAEVWFERGISLSRFAGNWIEYTRGQIGAGILWQTLGKDRRARMHFAKASKRAMRDGREWLAAEAQHDLLLMAAERGQYSEAEHHGRTALAWYPKNHERFPFFAADLAFLLVSKREYHHAIRLLLPFFRAVKQPPKQVLALSVLARALGSIGDPRFGPVRRRLLKRLERYREYEPAARVNLAEGERALGMWDEAEANARIALELAAARRDVVPERLARELLSHVAARTPPPALRTKPDEALAEFVSAAAERLYAWAPTRQGRRPRGGSDWAAA